MRLQLIDLSLKISLSFSLCLLAYEMLMRTLHAKTRQEDRSVMELSLFHIMLPDDPSADLTVAWNDS